VSATGGEPEVLAAVQPGESFGAPQLLDDGKILLFTVAPTAGRGGRWDRAQIVVQSVGSTERTVVLSGGSEGHYVPTGHLVYMLGNTLLATPFDPRTRHVRGGPIPIIEGVRRFAVDAANGLAPDASVAFSRAGSLVYLPIGSSLSVSESSQRMVALATRDGKLQSLNLPPRPYLFPRVSPDGRQLAIEMDDGTEAIIWIYDLKDEILRPLTIGGRSTYPLWAPDGRHVTYQSERDGVRGIFWQLADGTQPAEPLSKPEGLSDYRPETWNPDGTTLMFSAPVPGLHLFTLSGGLAKPFAAEFPALNSAFSPDGKWLAYTSTKHGNRTEIFVEPFPRRPGVEYQISTEGGGQPLWSPDGTHLYYFAYRSGSLVAVDVRTQPTFSFARSVTLPIEGLIGVASGRNYDMTRDGAQFVIIRPASVEISANQSSPPQINVVLNWFTDLQQRVPTR
jgi:hypothetical protein